MLINCIFGVILLEINPDVVSDYIRKHKNKIMELFVLINFLGPEMFVVFFAILLLFGGKKIPELMKGLGKGIKEFNSARANIESELKEGMKEVDEKGATK